MKAIARTLTYTFALALLAVSSCAFAFQITSFKQTLLSPSTYKDLAKDGKTDAIHAIHAARDGAHLRFDGTRFQRPFQIRNCYIRDHFKYCEFARYH